jgi:hypothetical protein
MMIGVIFMINNIYELAKFFGIDDAEDLSMEQIDTKINRYLFKYTDCGMGVCIEDDGITLSSIIEGWDEGFVEAPKLFYPIDKEDIDDWTEIVNRRACMCWDIINGEGEYADMDEDIRYEMAIDISING